MRRLITLLIGLLLTAAGFGVQAQTAPAPAKQAAKPAKPASLLPAGYDEVDISILDWIAAEGLRFGRSFVKM